MFRRKDRDQRPEEEIRAEVLHEFFKLVKKEAKGSMVLYSIPAEVMSSDKSVTVGEEEYDSWNIPGTNGHVSGTLIQMAIEDFDRTIGSPIWSQIVNTTGEETVLPQAIYLRAEKH